MVLNRQPLWQTVSVLGWPLGLDWTTPGSVGAGYWALATAGAASAITRASSSEMRMTASSPLWVDDVPARHPRVLMGEDVAVVEPATRVVLDEAGRDRFVGPH